MKRIYHEQGVLFIGTKTEVMADLRHLLIRDGGHALLASAVFKQRHRTSK